MCKILLNQQFWGKWTSMQGGFAPTIFWYVYECVWDGETAVLVYFAASYFMDILYYTGNQLPQ